MNGRLIIIRAGRPGADTKLFRAYLPANPGGVRKPVGVSVSTTSDGEESHRAVVIKCAAKAFKKLNGGELEEIETRVKVNPHPQPNTWFVELTK